jgi:hypothetical protein
VAIVVAFIGLATTFVSSVLACIPPADEPNKVLAVVKLLASSAGLVLAGAVVYWLGRRRAVAGDGLKSEF